MIKINCTLPDNLSKEYFAAIPPCIGDTICFGTDFFVVKNRTLFDDNPNFIVIRLEKTT